MFNSNHLDFNLDSTETGKSTLQCKMQGFILESKFYASPSVEFKQTINTFFVIFSNYIIYRIKT